MRILVDEDSQAKRLLVLLRESGHVVQSVADAGLEGEPDSTVLQAAAVAQCVVLTRNGKDFGRLHEQGIGHFGILVVNQDRDPSKDMSIDDIVRAIANLEASGWDISGQIVSLNDWQFVQE